MERLNPLSLKSLPEGNFFFKNQPNPKGERDIYLRYYIDETYVSVSTGVSVRPSDWHKSRQIVKPSHISSARLNSRLQLFKENINRMISEYNKSLTPEVVKKMMRGEFVTAETAEAMEKSKEFIDYALEYNQTCYNLEKLAYSTYNNDRYNIEKFRSYLLLETGEGGVLLCDLSVELFDKYKEFCLKTGNKKQSINKKLKPLFKAVEYAAKNDLIPNKLATNICDGYFNLKSRKYEAKVEEEEIHYLTDGQLQEFADLYNSIKLDRTKEYMDIFLFSFYACGLRFSDLLTLEWEHIDWKNNGRDDNRNHLPCV